MLAEVGSYPMRAVCAAVMIVLFAVPAYAQQKAVPRYGDTAGKTPQEIAAEREAEKAYNKSLGNIPDKGPTDPWGNVRSDAAPKPVAKDAPAKRAKAGGTAN
jgi:hypothetical protein